MEEEMKIVRDHCAEFIPPDTIAEHAEPAATFKSRLLGLMFRKSFGAIDAMVLSPCRSIHTFFMRFPLDILCLDSTDTIADIAERVSPWRAFIPCGQVSKIVELPAGAIKLHNIKKGEKIHIY